MNGDSFIIESYSRFSIKTNRKKLSGKGTKEKRQNEFFCRNYQKNVTIEASICQQNRLHFNKKKSYEGLFCIIDIKMGIIRTNRIRMLNHPEA